MSEDAKTAIAWIWKVVFTISASLVAYTFATFSRKLDTVHEFMLRYPAVTDARISAVERDHSDLKKDIELMQAEHKQFFYEQKQHNR